MRILIVDDDRTSRAFFRRELGAGGYEILEATDGFEAIHVIHDQEIDLVLLDIEMPDMDGYQVCSWLRSEQFSHRFNQKKSGLLPIIFVTSDHTLESRLKGFRAGATDFVTKDFKAGELLDIVNRILKPKNVLEGLSALVVDDSQMVREMVSGMLKEQGMTVFMATNGAEGYAVLLEHVCEIDMVITDLEMPVMKGDELCYKIRKEMGLKDLPVIFLTAIPDRGVLINLFKAGANDYLIKPFVKEELIARLKVTKELLQSLGDEVAARKRVLKDLEKSKALAKAHLQAAGKVEFANTVLHNVSNVLNSVNVSCAQVDNFLSGSRLGQLLIALRLLDKHKDDLADFLTNNSKGKQLPNYFRLVSDILEEEYRQLVEEVKEMHKKIGLMKEIVDTQQKHAVSDRGLGVYSLETIIDESLKVNAALISSFEVEVTKDFDPEENVYIHQVEFTHILINLFKNAVEAMREVSPRRLTISGEHNDSGRYILEISDSGCGIDPQHMARMFSHGFTTKEGGHGFGLPFCERSIHEMGGDIEVRSDGLGKGTTFVLTMPVMPEQPEV